MYPVAGLAVGGFEENPVAAWLAACDHPSPEVTAAALLTSRGFTRLAKRLRHSPVPVLCYPQSKD